MGREETYERGGGGGLVEAAKGASNQLLLNSTQYSHPYIDSTNATTTKAPPEDQSLWRYGLGVTVPLICIFGIIGNVLSLLVLRNRKKFGAVMFIYVRCMSMSDLLAMIICIPESITQGWRVEYDEKPAAEYFAHISVPLVNLFFGASTLIVLLMTVERFLSVCFPLKAKFLSTPVRAYIWIACVYILCFIIYAPTVAEFTVLENTPSNTSLVKENGKFIINWRVGYADNIWYRQVYSWLRAAIIRFIPFIVISILTACTIRSYRQIVLRRRRILNRPRRDERRFQEENNLIIILASTATVYIICLFPMPIAHVMLNINTLQENHGFQIYLVVGNNLEVLNAALNFYMYCLACKEFRLNARNLIHSWCIRVGLGRMMLSRPPEEDYELDDDTLAAGRSAVCTRGANNVDRAAGFRLLANGQTAEDALIDRAASLDPHTVTMHLNNSATPSPGGTPPRNEELLEKKASVGSTSKVEIVQHKAESIPLTYVNQHAAAGAEEEQNVLAE